LVALASGCFFIENRDSGPADASRVRAQKTRKRLIFNCFWERSMGISERKRYGGYWAKVWRKITV
jgi:hypothetical protein